MDKNVKVLVEEPPPLHLRFLPGADQVIVYKEGYEDAYSENELVVAVDTADFERLGKRGEIFRKAAVTMNIDHHPTNTKYASYNLVVSDASATGEILYNYFKDLVQPLNKDISTCLYTAISSDTGGFRFSNTSSLTHQIAADLIQIGADCAEISKNLFEDVSMNRLNVLAEIIHLIELYHHGKIGAIHLILLASQAPYAVHNTTHDSKKMASQIKCHSVAHLLHTSLLLRHSGNLGEQLGV
jgi:phosphoesterase RecJ-like protein